MAKVEIKSKEAKMRAAMSGGKSKRKKWSKGKNRDKLANLIMYDQKTYDKMLSEVPKMKLVSVSTVSERLKIGGSLARRTIKELVEKGTLRVVNAHSKGGVWTRATNTD